MGDETLDEVAAETGILYGVRAAKGGRQLGVSAIQRVAESAMADFIEYSSGDELDAMLRAPEVWHAAFARGYLHGVAAMSRPEQGSPEGDGGRILPFHRR